MILNFGDEILLRGVDWNNPSRVLLYKKSIFVFLLSLGYLFFLKLFLVLNWWARGAHPLNFFLCFPVSLSLFPLFLKLSHLSIFSIPCSVLCLSRNPLCNSLSSRTPTLTKTSHPQGHLHQDHHHPPTHHPPSSSWTSANDDKGSQKLRRVLFHRFRTW